MVVVSAVVVLSGCAWQHTHIRDTMADGRNRELHQVTGTLGDSDSKLADYKASANNEETSVGIGSLHQQTAASNIVELLRESSRLVVELEKLKASMPIVRE